MLKLESDIYVSPEDSSYLSVTDAKFLGGDYKGRYIVHAEGNPRVIYKLWKRYESDISQGQDVYFMLKKLQYFRNHCIEVAPGLYKYIPKEEKDVS